MDFFTKLMVIFLGFTVVFGFSALTTAPFGVYNKPKKSYLFFSKMIFVCLFAAAMTFLFGVG